MRKDLILQFKTHVWCHLELNTGGHYHACDTVLARLDSVQRNFIRSLDLSPTRAILDYNLAPLCLRRDIAMLGFIYNAVHGRTHAASQALFKRSHLAPSEDRRTRGSLARHSLQLIESACTHSPALLQRSIFGLVRVWNRLPHSFVSATTVSAFQSSLTALARHHCQHGHCGWTMLFSPRQMFTSVNEALFTANFRG
jgi:hypothetical protein